MPEATAKNPMIRQGWLRVVLFGAFFCVLSLLIAIPAALVLANLIAAPPGQAAARTQPATILRTE